MYTYNGITASLKDLCFIYDKDVNDVERLMETKSFEEALEESPFIHIAKNGLSYLSQKSDDIEIGYLTDYERATVDKYVRKVDTYIAKHKIVDDDLKQELYLAMIKAVVDYNDDISVDLSMYIDMKLRSKYLAYLRDECRRHRIQDGRSLVNISEDDYLIDKYDREKDIVTENALSANLESSMSKLSEREQYIVTKYFGLYGNQPMSFQALGDELGTSHTAVRDHVVHALRTLRKPATIKKLQDYL